MKRAIPGALVALFVLAHPGHAQQSLAGTYVADAAASEDIGRVIDAATASMSFIKRPIARKRLRATNPPTRTIDIMMRGDTLELVADSSVSVATIPNGAPIRWSGFKGEAMTVTTSLEAGVLDYVFDAKDGRRHNRYHLREDGALELTVTLTSPRLPGPVTYVRVFRRS